MFGRPSGKYFFGGNYNFTKLGTFQHFTNVDIGIEMLELVMAMDHSLW